MAKRRRNKMFKKSEEIIKKSLEHTLGSNKKVVKLTHADLLIYHNMALKA